jgi:REP-associated tyrosine transposase
MNRAARRLPLFDGDEDYAAFLRVLRDAQDRIPLRLLCYALMRNHWHLVLWPAQDEELPRFMAWLTSTHSRRWHLKRGSVGSGTIYQGRYKAIAVKDDGHFLVVCRYVERNPVKARLVAHATDWPWGSGSVVSGPMRPQLAEWPVSRPERWRDYVDGAECPGEFERLQAAIRSGTPYGPDGWREDTAQRLGWPFGLRPPGRPRRR